MKQIHNILQRIYQERVHQQELVEKGKFKFTCSMPASFSDKLAILAEGFGEVSEQVCELSFNKLCGGNTSKLQYELIQVAAVACAWAEAIEDFLSQRCPDCGELIIDHADEITCEEHNEKAIKNTKSP